MTSLLFDPRGIRMRTCDGLSQLGFGMRFDHLPLVFSPGEDVALRPLRELESRAAILNIVQARVFDMPPPMAMRWLLDAHVLEDLTPREWQFIASGRGDARMYSEQLEALYTLAWVLGLVSHLDPSAYCVDSLPSLMPDLRTAESFTSWRSRTLPSRRDAREVAEMLDLYCCLDWLCGDARQRGTRSPAGLDESLIWHRRWALEWAVVTHRNGRSIGTPWER